MSQTLGYRLRRAGVVATAVFALTANAGVPAVLSGIDRLYDSVPRQVQLSIEEGRLIASNVRLSRLDELELEPDERIAETAEAEAVLVVITNLRALGYGPVVGWRELELEAGEEPETVAAEDFAAFVTTTRRLLNFNADTGIWAATRRPGR